MNYLTTLRASTIFLLIATDRYLKVNSKSFDSVDLIHIQLSRVQFFIDHQNVPPLHILSQTDVLLEE